MRLNDTYRRNDIFCGFTSTSRWFLEYSLLLVFLLSVIRYRDLASVVMSEFISALGYHTSTNTFTLLHHEKTFINVLKAL